jgi:hypothetical protein
MQQQLHVDTVGVQLMASRWSNSAGELVKPECPAGPAQSCQASAAAVEAARADIRAFTAALATRVGAHALHLANADARYVAKEADSANQLAASVHPVTGI